MPEFTRRALFGLAGGIALLPFVANRAAAKLGPEAMAQVARVEDYLNRIKSLQANFVQIGPNGELARGTLYMRRPGRLRFEYEPPTPILIVADGLWLVLHDKELGQVNRLPLYETPLGVLVAKEVDLSDKVRVTDVAERAGILRVTVQDKDRPDEGLLTIAFSEPPLQLRQWAVQDAQGGITNVSLSEITTNIELDPKLFTFTDPQPFSQQR